MKLNFKKEIFYLLISAIPIIYLGRIYADLPDTVPTHFDLNGNANGWSSKGSHWFIPACITLAINVLMLLLPMIDPKRRLRNSSGKFEHIRFVVVLFIAVLSCMILYTAGHQHINHLNKFLFAFMGLFFAALGNFFPSLKPNYFIGIRSPWALENETVWKKTHQMAGKLWVAGGLLLAVLAFVVPSNGFLGKIALPLLLTISFFPVLYSYFIWRQVKKDDKIKTPL